MNNKIGSVSYIPLINSWEEYLSSGGTPDLQLFADWLKQKHRSVMQSNVNDSELATYFNTQTVANQYTHLSSEAAFILWRLSKFIRVYSRPVLAANGLTSQDEFAILAHVDYLKSCSKKEAIEANIIDLSTGVEIIRRLIRQGLLSEKPNKADKRERLISLTAAGKKTLYAIYRGFADIQDVLADLNDNERENLYQILKNLDDFHTHQLEKIKGNKKI